MIPSDRLYAAWRREEGFELQAYLCPAGVWTIGYGHTAGVKPGDVIDLATAEQYMRDDVSAAASVVNRLVKRTLTQGQFEALVLFVGNFGETKFAKSELLSVINAGRMDQVHGQWMRWVYAKDKDSDQMVKLSGLISRRKRELEFWDDGAGVAGDHRGLPPEAVTDTTPGLWKTVAARSRTMWGLYTGALGMVAMAIENGLGWLSDLATFADRAAPALGSVGTLMAKAASVAPGLGGALIAVGLVWSASRRLDAGNKGKIG